MQDGYFGSGSELAKAKKLYGTSSFHKEILCWCDSREKALEVERLIVRKDDESTFNKVAGGAGGNSAAPQESLQSYSDSFLECFNGMHGVYSESHLHDCVKRDPHWTEAMQSIKEFRRKMEESSARHPERIKKFSKGNWELA